MTEQTAEGALTKRARASVEVSVVLPFKDAAPHLAEQLEALAVQGASFSWEVVAVDDHSTDGSREIAEGSPGA